MTKLSKTERKSTVVITDIRNFTGIFEHFQNRDDPRFLVFMNEYYETQMEMAELLSRGDVHVSATGDGILSIFMGKNNVQDGYAYALTMYRILTKRCKEFSENNDIKLSFGIGADSGDVWIIKRTRTRSNISTYLGSVINRASRIESSTKSFYHTNMAVGGYLYLNLIRILYPDYHDDLYRLMSNYDQLLQEQPETILMSQKLLLYYIFETELKGVGKPIPLFRLSPTLAMDDTKLTYVLKKLTDPEKIEEIFKQINNQTTQNNES